MTREFALGMTRTCALGMTRPITFGTIRMLTLVCAGAAVFGLAACGERQQTAQTRKPDTEAWKGTDTAFAANGWKAGDKAAWEEQLRLRAQAQNEYTRAK